MNDRDYRPRSDYGPPRRRRKKKGGSPVGLLAGSVVGGFVLIVLAVVLFRGMAFGPSNPNVTPENLHKLRSGMTLAEIEAVLGPSRPANAGDVVAVFGPENERFGRGDDGRMPWVWNIQTGHVRAWENGSLVALVVFHQPPEQGGRQLGMAYRSGGGVWVEHAALPEDQPGVVNVTVENLVAEVAADPAAAAVKYRAKRLLVTGVVQQPAAGTGLTIRVANGRGAVHAQLPPQHVAVFGQKRAGETIRFYGKLQGYHPANNIVVLTECILDN